MRLNVTRQARVAAASLQRAQLDPLGRLRHRPPVLRLQTTGTETVPEAFIASIATRVEWIEVGQAQCRVCAWVKSSAAAMRRLGDVESEAECTEAKRRRGSRSAGADRSLCPNAQTKTHVSMSLQSHFAAHGHCTARQSRSVFAAAKGVPMTRPVTPVHRTGAMPANCEATCGHGTVGMQGPDAHAGAVQE